jgi:multisubunit Na+/H+ antiporter MnhG subunit
LPIVLCFFLCFCKNNCFALHFIVLIYLLALLSDLPSLALTQATIDDGVATYYQS